MFDELTKYFSIRLQKIANPESIARIYMYIYIYTRKKNNKAARIQTSTILFNSNISTNLTALELKSIARLLLKCRRQSAFECEGIWMPWSHGVNQDLQGLSLQGCCLLIAALLLEHAGLKAGDQGIATLLGLYQQCKTSSSKHQP